MLMLRNKIYSTPSSGSTSTTTTKKVFDLILLGVSALRFRSQPNSLKEGRNKGVDLQNGLKKLHLESDFFKMAFIPIMTTMANLVTNKKIKKDLTMFKEVKPYNVFIIEGPSGVGKSTMMEELPSFFQQVRVVTTRRPRATDGVDKIYVSK